MRKQKCCEHEELSEYQKFILSQMVNSDAKTIEEIGLMYQKQLAEYINNRTFTEERKAND